MSEEKNSVVIVTTLTGREWRYEADGWDAEEAVDVTRDSLVVATYPPGTWICIRKDGVIANDDQAQALGIARAALEAVARISDPNVAIQLADDALRALFDLGYE